jgi:hypothetical protein
MTSHSSLFFLRALSYALASSPELTEHMGDLSLDKMAPVAGSRSVDFHTDNAVITRISCAQSNSYEWKVISHSPENRPYAASSMIRCPYQAVECAAIHWLPA